MRTKDGLKMLDDVTVFMKYLYMNSEHKITYHNGIVNLTLRMTSDMKFKVKNTAFPNTPEMNVSQDITLSFIVGLIEKLKTQPPELYNSFNSRWDEIYGITLSNSALNQLHK